MSQMSDSHTDDSSLRPMTINMDIEPDVQNNVRKYPSINDYYRASSSGNDVPIQLQSGLSNYSSLVLGDDRIAFSESVLSATYRIPVEDKMVIESPSKTKSRHHRQREYQDATKKVGEAEIDRLERVMKDKLFQRSKATSSPFQVRKAFKFFDREQVLRIPIEGFTKALEFLGFQFSELQNLALFGRYDTECTGDIDYMNFISTAMFYAAIEPDFGQHHKKARGNEVQLMDASDMDPEELKHLQEAELRHLFNKVDQTRSGALDRDGFELLLMAMGHQLTVKELDACLTDMGVSSASGPITFQLFLDWWTDSMGMDAMRKKTASRK
jgi:Ca2+-binding EF-hand superfamily protein